MTLSFIASRLQLPAQRPGLVLRLRLLQQLNAGLSSKLTLISASTGFGKSQCGRLVAWLAVIALSPIT